MPNYFQRGRMQLHYLDANGQRTQTPISVYAANVLLPEKEAMNLCLKANALFPYSLIDKVWNSMGTHLGGRFFSDAQSDFWHGKAVGFYTPYYRTGNVGSFVYGQIANQYLNANYDAITIIRPKHYDANKTYPVVFFCHGYLGSWELYQGILSKLDNCIVVSIGTKRLDGLTFNVDNVFKRYIPYVQSLGYNIDMAQLHIMGLSNGGSAANQALQHYDKKFKTITFLSTPCHAIKSSKTKVLLVGGGKDASSQGLPTAEKQLKAKGTKVAIYYDSAANHYIFAYQQNEIMDFIKSNL